VGAGGFAMSFERAVGFKYKHSPGIRLLLAGCCILSTVIINNNNNNK